MIKNLTVIGAGTMGNGIAHTFAQNNFNVNLVDISSESLDKALKNIEKNLDRMLAKEKITEEEKQNTLSNITTYTDLNDGVKEADLVVEAAGETATGCFLCWLLEKNQRNFAVFFIKCTHAFSSI